MRAAPPVVEYRVAEFRNVAVPAARLTGTWYRELPGCVIAITLQGDECHVTLSLNDSGIAAKVTLTADCSVTKDKHVYGSSPGPTST